ncbi:YbbR-like domain-containing protein [Sporolactobacillus pectinivorans]|uniref:CdaR family protein n=1 Tax=Sporolactobacillus pectinivorans TaxID=1591408 RepID=UPI000C256DC3|nr:CdaR family protein [Sporolactobacillus pectinivorans]
MDKLLRKNWVVKIISFVLALMLYAIVSAGQSPSSSPSSIAVNPLEQMTIAERLNLKYDANKFVVSGVPQTVDLRLSGTSDQILKARLLAIKSAFIDLNGMKPGTYDVRVQTSGFPSGLSVKAVPSAVRVTLQERTSKEFPVALDILNKKAISSGYSIGSPTIDPKTVTVTGGRQTIDSIAFIRGVIDVNGANTTADKMITLHAYDSGGDQMDVAIAPSAVHVQVPITKMSKQVTLQALTTGTPANGYSVGSVNLSVNNVTVVAPDSNTLNQIVDVQPISVSVAGLTQDKTYNVSVPLPAGATQASPSKVSVTVHIVPTASGGSSMNSSGTSSSSPSSSSGASSSSNQGNTSKQFSNIPVSATGLAVNQTVTLGNNGHVDVSVTGSATDLNKLSSSDIKAQVDLTGLSTGDQRVAVNVSVPAGLTASASPGTLNVTIS